MEHATCVTTWSTTRKELEKKLLAMKKKYSYTNTKKKSKFHYLVKDITASEFGYKGIYPDDEIGSKGITLKQTDAIGMTVGSCNPFTKGHRHLAEVGSKMFDYFIFFVMQDGYDLLFNKHDSEQLIKIGVQDLKNVIVVPFPNNMISYSEFCPSYNSVAIRHSKNFIGINVYELGNYLVMLCKACNINHYISGIEINDAVTRQMGLHFKYICELNDINFIAIPRIKNNDGKAISGTKCRELLRLKKFNELHDYMQNEVIKYIIDNNVEVKEFTKHKHLEDVLVQHDKNIYNHFGDKLDMISVQKDDYLSVIDDIKIIISSKNKYELNYDDESRNDLINIYHNNKIMSPWAAYFCYKLKIDTSKEIYDYIMNSKLDIAHKDDIKNES
jgi:hypothetical protein